MGEIEKLFNERLKWIEEVDLSKVIEAVRDAQIEKLPNYEVTNKLLDIHPVLGHAKDGAPVSLIRFSFRISKAKEMKKNGDLEKIKIFQRHVNEFVDQALAKMSND